MPLSTSYNLAILMFYLASFFDSNLWTYAASADLNGHLTRTRETTLSPGYEVIFANLNTLTQPVVVRILWYVADYRSIGTQPVVQAVLTPPFFSTSFRLPRTAAQIVFAHNLTSLPEFNIFPGRPFQSRRVFRRATVHFHSYLSERAPLHAQPRTYTLRTV
ncbi:hypothetical protein F5882DRAFT_78998 [Hyaloscypha sp. PMI_1271]|nr:hypothetical protein F5882DRAFT_78998 [Hyaloscypha sp. PMI_1271]